MLRELHLLQAESPAGIVLIGLALVFMVFRTVSPWGRRLEGRTIRRLPVPLSARVRRHRVPLVLLLAVSVVDAVVGWVALMPQVAGWILAICLLAIPTRCLITEHGIRIGWTPFRRWTEFAGVGVRRGKIRLQPLSGLADMEIPLPGRFEDAEVVSQLRLLIRASYQGTAIDEGGSPEASDESNGPLVLA